jgi:hypothetical protein
VLAAALDGGLRTWPLATAGWAALLALRCARDGRVVYTAGALAAGATLAPPAAAMLPIMTTYAWRTAGRTAAARLLGLGLLALALAAGLRVALGWPVTPAVHGWAFLTMGAHNLWWLLLENMALDLRAEMTVGQLPLYLWSALAWLPFGALALAAVWRGVIGPFTAGTFALYGLGMLLTGQSAADPALTVVPALGMASEGRRWLALGCSVAASAVANILLAPLGLPTGPPLQAGVDVWTLHALVRVALLVGWAAALVWLVARDLPDAWRRALASEPGD